MQCMGGRISIRVHAPGNTRVQVAPQEMYSKRLKANAMEDAAVVSEHGTLYLEIHATEH